MRIFYLSIIVLQLGATAGAGAVAEEVRQKAATCTACHGANGVSVNSLWPNLAGQKAEYLIKQLKAFRDGVRVDPLMSPVSKMLSDDDIQALAKYYAGLQGAP